MSEFSDAWVRVYKQKGALWIHDGNPQCPHVLLTSGKHSDGFFNSELVMEDPSSLDKACAFLLHLLEKEEAQLGPLGADRVVGPAMGAITLAHDMARHISRQQNSQCLRSYVEKEGEGKDKRMVFRRTSVCPGEQVLLVEDVLTTGESIELAAEAVIQAGGILRPCVAVLVNCSGLAEIGGKKIIALIDHPIHNWGREGCPLCASGSEAIRPKISDNWERLNSHH